MRHVGGEQGLGQGMETDEVVGRGLAREGRVEVSRPDGLQGVAPYERVGGAVAADAAQQDARPPVGFGQAFAARFGEDAGFAQSLGEGGHDAQRAVEPGDEFVARTAVVGVQTEDASVRNGVFELFLEAEFVYLAGFGKDVAFDKLFEKLSARKINAVEIGFVSERNFHRD